MPEQQKPVTAPSLVKEWFGAAREGVIVLAVVILFVKPSWIGTIAEEAGLKKAFGLEFVEQQVEASKAETSKAQEAIGAITEELGQVKDQLQQLSTTAGRTNPAISREITRISSNVDNLATRSMDIKGSLQTSMQAQEDALKAARGELPSALLKKP
jgi:prefoldin subunit 5